MNECFGDSCLDPGHLWLGCNIPSAMRKPVAVKTPVWENQCLQVNWSSSYHFFKLVVLISVWLVAGYWLLVEEPSSSSFPVLLAWPATSVTGVLPRGVPREGCLLDPQVSLYVAGWLDRRRVG